MANQARARIAFLGGFVFLLGLAISGMLRASPASANSHAQHFDTTRGQMGFLLRAVEHREIGIGLMVVGAGILSFAVLKQKWR
jgi:hypothetical protein